MRTSTPYRSMTSFYWSWSYKFALFKQANDLVLLDQTGLVGTRKPWAFSSPQHLNDRWAMLILCTVDFPLDMYACQEIYSKTKRKPTCPPRKRWVSLGVLSIYLSFSSTKPWTTSDPQAWPARCARASAARAVCLACLAGTRRCQETGLDWLSRRTVSHDVLLHGKRGVPSDVKHGETRRVQEASEASGTGFFTGRGVLEPGPIIIHWAQGTQGMGYSM